MKKFLIAEAEKARILGMHYNAMGKKIINEQKMLDFGGVFQALSVSDWFNTPDVTAQWKQGSYRDQESKMKGNFQPSSRAEIKKLGSRAPFH